MDDYAELISVLLCSCYIVVDVEAGADVALHAHTVDIACCCNGLQHLKDVFLLGCLILVIVVIEELYSGRCVLSCELESLLYVIVTDYLLPVAVSHSPIICGSIIYYVPCVDNAGVVLLAPVHYLVDVALHSLEHKVSACELAVDIVVLIEEPGRCLRIPYESMTSHRDVVLLAVVKDRLCCIEMDGRCLIVLCGISLALSAVKNGIGLQFILRCNGIELSLKKLSERIVLVRHYRCRRCNAELEVICISSSK